MFAFILSSIAFILVQLSFVWVQYVLQNPVVYMQLRMSEGDESLLRKQPKRCRHIGPIILSVAPQNKDIVIAAFESH